MSDTFTSAIGRISASLTAKFTMLIGIFVALPFILYGQLAEADRQTRTLLADSIKHGSWLIAQSLTPVLGQAGELSNPAIGTILNKFAQDGTVLQLMFHPNSGRRPGSFYFVASAPPIPTQGTAAQLDDLAQHGILKSLGDSCTGREPLEFRYAQQNSTKELLTSVVPIESQSGCWALVSTHNGSEFLSTSLSEPYWQTRGVRIAAAVYIAFAGLAILVAESVRRALRHFRSVAREIRQGGSSKATFYSRNIVPELASVAGDFDHLVYDLRRAAADIRETAEENAHAIKTPLATIRSALESIKRVVDSSDQRSRRAVCLIESSLSRLTVLVSASQRLGNDTANFIEAPKLSINLTMLIIDVLQNTRDFALEKNINLIHRLAVDVHVLASRGILEVIVENILDNAISFAKDRDIIMVTLSKSDDRIDLCIDDQGPGIDPRNINHVFERYVSHRPSFTPNGVINSDAEEPCHAGLGLWIVRRHVEGLGGEVTATNLVQGGLRVRVTLPPNASHI